MPGNPLTLGLLSDFNAHNLAVSLEKNAGSMELSCKLAPYGQTMSVLHDENAEFWSIPYDALIIWTIPDRVIPSFKRVTSFEEISINELLQEVDSFAAQIKRIPVTIRTVFLPCWIAPEAGRGLGPLDLTNNAGITNILMRMNLRLADNFENDRRVILLDAHRWLFAAGAASFNPKLWYMSKTPFNSTVFQEASRDILSAINGILGLNKKVVILDLDETLWGGIVGDVGWEKLTLGGHDHNGEAFVDFQRSLKQLTNRGILLAVVSKNEESTALEAIRRHPEMALKVDDFSAWKINWQDKAVNIVELMSSLNLGMESAIFLDDSPFERARVREALPQVLVPELPADPTHYASFLRNLRCFDNPFISKEDRTRTKMYVADRRRSASKSELSSLEEWLESLELSIIIELLNEKNLERAAQLFNKTNQMNLRTRRLTTTELYAWAQAERHSLWTYRVSDKFGDYGLCGISSLVQQGTKGVMVDFLLSCRVMGRGVEESILCSVIQYAKKIGCEDLYAEFIPSKRNQPCETWLRKQPNLTRKGDVFCFSFNSTLDFPRHVRVTMV
jgi:FkbH-like protein